MDAESHNSEQPAPLPLFPWGPAIGEWVATLIQVILCSDYPTQLLLGRAFAGLDDGADGRLSLRYLAAVELGDTVLLVGLIWIFLLAGRERPSHLFLGGAPVAGEARAGLPLTFVALAIAAATILTVRTFIPSLHTVAENPFQEVVHSPRDAAVFTLVVIAAGGIREELQRAFLLSRFERSLGGKYVGLAVTSAAFGYGHMIQGADAAIATALLGAFWGIVYLRRRSVVAAMVSHSGFNLLQLLPLLGAGR